MRLGHALSRHGRVQPTSSTAPMGLPQLNDKVAMIQRAGCVFLDHVLVAIKNLSAGWTKAGREAAEGWKTVVMMMMMMMMMMMNDAVIT